MIANEEPATGPELSAVVVAHEPDPRLSDALASVSFADEVILVALDGFEGAEAVAREVGAELIEHPEVPYVEMARRRVVERVENDWVLFVDPDERVSRSLAQDIRRTLLESGPEVGSVVVPWQFYFRGQELTTTVWGKENQRKTALVHRERVRLHPAVHRGIELRSGYRSVRIEREADNVLHHYWCDSYGEFFRKHRRYLRHEGEGRRHRGMSFSWARMTRETVASLARNLVYHRGMVGGVDSIALSFLHAWYTARSWLSLRAEEAGRREEE